ncbi:hypothetical protein ACFZ8E_02955 [Methylobacterium sp. HMF5984]|uniref:hypothetical protein n=1 Tax=Methylobacterium sp. HMF5984 TaxID=3367370 RepID=UPI0038545BC5
MGDLTLHPIQQQQVDRAVLDDDAGNQFVRLLNLRQGVGMAVAETVRHHWQRLVQDEIVAMFK